MMRWSFWRDRAPALCGLALLLMQARQARHPEDPGAPRQSWSFALQGATSVAVHSFHAGEARLGPSRDPAVVTISGRPRLLPNGPHTREPDVYAKPAQEWHFTWALRRLEKSLDARALGETLAPAHRFYLDEMEIQAPAGVTVTLTKQPLDFP